MELLKQKWFWVVVIALVVVGVVAAFVFTGNLDADKAISYIATAVLSLVVGFLGGKTAKVLLPLALALSLSACIDTQAKTLSAVQKMSAETRQEATAHYDPKCLRAAREGGLQSDAYLKCDKNRHIVYSACKAGQRFVQTWGAAIPLIEEMKGGSK